MTEPSIDGGCVTVYVADLGRARRFYEGVLGLAVRLAVPDRWLELDAGRGLRIALRPAALESATPGGGGMAIGLGVGEGGLAATVRALAGRGVDLEIRDDPEEPVRVATFRDPDGNRLYLWETR